MKNQHGHASSHWVCSDGYTAVYSHHTRIILVDRTDAHTTNTAAYTALLIVVPDQYSPRHPIPPLLLLLMLLLLYLLSDEQAYIFHRSRRWCNMKCAAFLLAGGAVCAQAFMTAPLASTRTSTAASRVSGMHMSATSELPTQV